MGYSLVSCVSAVTFCNLSGCVSKTYVSHVVEHEDLLKYAIDAFNEAWTEGITCSITIDPRYVLIVRDRGRGVRNKRRANISQHTRINHLIKFT